MPFESGECEIVDSQDYLQIKSLRISDSTIVICVKIKQCKIRICVYMKNNQRFNSAHVTSGVMKKQIIKIF
jgi:hypothetical protein